MKNFVNFLRTIGIILILVSLSNCDKEQQGDAPYELPTFKNVYENLVKDHLDLPSGLSSGYNLKKTVNKSAIATGTEIEGIFVEAPLFVINRIENTMEPYQNPRISKYSGDLQNLSISSLTDIDLATYFSDFDSPIFYPLGDSLWRAKGITLDGLVLNDGSILSSSNSSDKIFKRTASGGIEVLLQDPRLERITGMTYATNGKVYAVQAPLVDDNDVSLVLYPKRVISVENAVIKIEYDLPSNMASHSWAGISNPPYWWRDAPLYEKLKIVENSENGKKQFGAEFYISDLFEGKVYKVDASNKVEILAQGLRYPSSLAVDSTGNIFYTTTPLWRNRIGSGENFEYKFSLNMLNPETGVSSTIYSFNDETLGDYSALAGHASVFYNGYYYYLPVGFNISNVLYESRDKLEFLITNSLLGTLKSVTIEK